MVEKYVSFVFYRGCVEYFKVKISPKFVSEYFGPN